MATFVLVHGGGHGSWCWDRIVHLLRAGGHQVHAPCLTGVGERASELSPSVNLSTHVADVVSLIEREDLRDVILAGHSYGGMVITGVAGQVPARIAELVFLDAPQPREGECLADASPGMREVLGPQVRSVNGVELCLFPDEHAMAVYGLVDPADLAWALPLLTPHPWACFLEPLGIADPAGLAQVPRTAIDCPPRASRRDQPVNGHLRRADRAMTMDTGHDLMITQPRELAELLDHIAAHPLPRKP